MNDYDLFLQSKQKNIIQSGFNPKELNKNLFPFQEYIVRKALNAGKYAIFADCGLGKTIMQLEWAHRVALETKKPVLILAPLAVSSQTINEGIKFGIPIQKLDVNNTALLGIYITNYEQLDNIDTSLFSGVVLDESSILKNFTGKTKQALISLFKDTPYKLACTATPSPNDLNELGNHSEFLSYLDAPDMRSRWFVRDEGMNNYRLKGHAEKDFFSWVSSWATLIAKPSDIGFKDDNYILPSLNFIEKKINTERRNNGQLFNNTTVNATSFNKELRLTINKRLDEVKDVVNQSSEPFIIWVNQNAEAEAVLKAIPDAVEVKGSDKPETKEKRLLGFAKGDFRVLVTKKKIAQYGLNYQNCNNQIFMSLDFSFEGLYQAIRRSYRFGQKKAVNIWLITTDTMGNVLKSIKEKETNFKKMQDNMNKSINKNRYGLIMDYEKREEINEFYHFINGDSVEEIKSIPSNSIDLSIFSPPFSTLFTYSNNLRDLGNCESDDEFFEQNQFLLDELYRIIKPGRLVCVHTKDLARYKGGDGFSGMYDFTGDYHRAMERAGFKYHSKVTIWTDPVLEMQRTKTQRLLYKQLRKDSSYTGVGMPEYVTIFRKWEGNEEDWTPITNKNTDNFPLDVWQKWASPVWMDIRRTDVLNDWRSARVAKDEKHICPLQLPVIERCIAMWSNKGEKVFTPFGGIGSEVYQAIKMNRYGIGIELKPSYYDQAISNCNKAIQLSAQLSLL